MPIKPDPRFAHSAGSGGDTDNATDAVVTRDDDAEDVHPSVRTTTRGVETPEHDPKISGRARLDAPPYDIPNRGV